MIHVTILHIIDSFSHKYHITRSHIIYQKMSSDWSSGICGCFENISICAKAYFCPCIVAGRNAEEVGEGCCLHGFYSLLGCIGIFCAARIREKIREEYSIEGSFGKDCLMHWCCPVCAYAQEAREIESRAPAGQSMHRMHFRMRQETPSFVDDVLDDSTPTSTPTPTEKD